MSEFDQPGELMKQTIALLNSSTSTVYQVAQDTGIPFHWLLNFGASRYRNPSVNRVQYLYEHLKKQRLLGHD